MNALKELGVSAAIDPRTSTDVTTRNTRRIRLYLASHWPSAEIFAHAMNQLRSP